MNKRHVLLLTAALGMATAQAQSTTPNTVTTTTTVVRTAGDPQLSNAAVTFNVTQAGNNLTATLIALAKSAGYEIIIEPAASAALLGSGQSAQAPAGGQLATYNFVNRPFNEVWPLLLDLYGLSYENVQVGSTTILRVSMKPIQRVVALPSSLSAQQVERQLKLSFGTLKRIETISSQGSTANGTAPVVTNSVPVVQEDIVLDSATMKIVAEPTSNSIIVRGTNQEVAQVLGLLNNIIESQKVNPTPTTAQTTAPVQRIYVVRGQVADMTALLTAEYPSIKVTPVGQTGQLVLNGSQTQIDAALALLGQVDQAPAVAASSQTVQKVFQLVNASAEEVKATLEGTLARDLTTTAEPLPNVPVTATDANGNTTVMSVPNALGQVANQGTTKTTTTATVANPQQATLIADKRTNSLIVRGTPEQVAQIAELIPQLDQTVPQVNVQVRIQEITKEATNSLGLNWRASFGGFNVAVGSAGLSTTFNPTQSFVGFNIFPTLKALETQNLTRTVYDGNVTMQSGQRSLGSSGGAQNASSTAAASITCGGRLELNIPSAAGNIVRQIDYGLNLDFFDPQVAPDGSITLRVRGQVNNLKTAVSGGAALPNNLDFSNSEAQSTITFKNGQTVLMSGLLSTNNKDTRAGVPFLSSLPVVGAAFGEQTQNRKEAQLLIIITGNIVK